MINCYLEDSDDDEEDKEKLRSKYKPDKKIEHDWKFYSIIVCIVILGIALQPVYLLFKFIIWLMELYRKCGCWVFFYMSM